MHTTTPTHNPHPILSRLCVNQSDPPPIHPYPLSIFPTISINWWTFPLSPPHPTLSPHPHNTRFSFPPKSPNFFSPQWWEAFPRNILIIFSSIFFPTFDHKPHKTHIIPFPSLWIALTKPHPPFCCCRIVPLVSKKGDNTNDKYFLISTHDDPKFNINSALFGSIEYLIDDEKETRRERLKTLLILKVVAKSGGVGGVSLVWVRVGGESVIFNHSLNKNYIPRLATKSHHQSVQLINPP